MIIDAWMQHPSAEFLKDPMFEPLRRWSRGELAGGEVPVEATLAAMDAAGVRTGMLCAWWGPQGPLATKYPNVYIDTSAYKCRRYPRELLDYLRGHGRRKVLFGSNHPAWPAADCLARPGQSRA